MKHAPIAIAQKRGAPAAPGHPQRWGGSWGERRCKRCWGWEGLSWGIFGLGCSPSPRHCLEPLPSLQLWDAGGSWILSASAPSPGETQGKNQCPQAPSLGDGALTPPKPPAVQAGSQDRQVLPAAGCLPCPPGGLGGAEWPGMCGQHCRATMGRFGPRWGDLAHNGMIWATMG